MDCFLANVWGGGEFESALGYVARLGESTTTSTDQQLEVGQFKELAEGNANRACIVARSGVSDVSGGGIPETLVESAPLRVV